MKKTLFHAIIFLSLIWSNSAISQSSSSYKLGYGFSGQQYATVGFSIKRFGLESRIFTNYPVDNFSDFGLIATVDYLQKPDYELYVGSGILLDFNWEKDFLTFPIGMRVMPFDNKSLAFQFEIAPSFVYQFSNAFLDTKMTGSFGLRYTLSQFSVRQASEMPTYDQAWYITGMGQSVGVGVQYSRLKNNWDYHAGLTSFPMTNLYSGVYYHFWNEERKQRYHWYTGMDVGYAFTYVAPGMTAYVPLGIQTVYASGYTLCFEISAVCAEATWLPLAGIKIGKVIL